ncbi:MAG: thiol:disulfide interchange protein DsbA/DsbL [Lysobacter sp.]
MHNDHSPSDPRFLPSPSRSRGTWLTAVSVVALSLLPLASWAAPPAAPALVAGVDYVDIPGGTAFAPHPGRIEVVEVFGYTCPHCAQFEPSLSAWKTKLPADVEVVAVPAPFGGYWIPYAQAFYAAQSMGLLERTHSAMFRAIHEQRRLPIGGATPAQIAAFYADYGVDPEKFAQTMVSPGTQAKLVQARDFLQRSGIEGTPSLVVAGKYRVLGKSAADMLRIAGELVQRERATQPRSNTEQPKQKSAPGT